MGMADKIKIVLIKKKLTVKELAVPPEISAINLRGIIFLKKSFWKLLRRLIVISRGILLFVQQGNAYKQCFTAKKQPDKPLQACRVVFFFCYG